MVKPERWSLRMRFVVEYLLAMRKALGFYTQRFKNKNKTHITTTPGTRQ